MATQNKGIMGSISGKVGDKFYSNRNGICYVRSLPKKSTKEASPAQVNQRQKMKMAVQLLGGIRSFLIASALKPNRYYGLDFAMKSVLTSGITGSHPNLSIDYPNLKITNGSVCRPEIKSFELDVNFQLQISWHQIFRLQAYPDDELVVLICEEKHQRIWLSSTPGIIRSTGKVSLDFSKFASGQVFQCWVAFKASDSRRCSENEYAGSFLIPPKKNDHESV